MFPMRKVRQNTRAKIISAPVLLCIMYPFNHHKRHSAKYDVMMTQQRGPITKFANTRNAIPPKFKDTKLVFLYYANLQQGNNQTSQH